MSSRKRGFLTILLLISAIMLAACKNHQSTKTAAEKGDTAFFAMNTFITLSAYGETVDTALSEAQDKFMELEKLWSVTDEDSEIYKINHSAGKPVAVSDDTKEVIGYALKMAEATDGALEPTLYPVLSAWGFTTGGNRIPDKEELLELLKTVGYEKVMMQGGQICLEERSQLDLGAVGKGYAGDIIAELLRENGILSALLDIGGNIQMIGKKPDGEDWKVALQNPFGDGNYGILSVSDCAVVTSGSYERYFVGEDGHTYGHILDPKTGYPVENDLASVTVIAPEGKRSDALSTALYVMGLDSAIEYWRRNAGFDMILVSEDGDIHITEGCYEQFDLGDASGDIEVYVIEKCFDN